MTANEKRILKAVVEHQKSPLSPADLINSIAKGDSRPVENLVSMGYLQEVPREHRDMQGGYYNVNFYRATEKGLLVFSPWYNRLWFGVKGDIRTIVVAAITALITILIAIFLEKILR